jgi:hypothetical protein
VDVGGNACRDAPDERFEAANDRVFQRVDSNVLKQ